MSTPMDSSVTAPESTYRRSSKRSPNKTRALNATDLGITVPSAEELGAYEPPMLLQCTLSDQDPVLEQVSHLLRDGYAGIVFVGPPGTSKSWYARQIASYLVDRDPSRVQFVQFHASYQYEDFIEGFVPRDGSGFELRDKHFLEMCNIARANPGKNCVLVIDELSRCDPGRVFGEALTYLETSLRNVPFQLASGREVSIPSNLVILATMNQYDRGVDEVDAALQRRLAKIAMDPNPEILDKLLTDNGMPSNLKARVVTFFNTVKRQPNRLSWLGHAYFRSVKDEDGLRRLWEHQLRFHFEKAFLIDTVRGEHESYSFIKSAWERVIPAKEANVTAKLSPEAGTTEGDSSATQTDNEPAPVVASAATSDSIASPTQERA